MSQYRLFALGAAVAVALGAQSLAGRTEPQPATVKADGPFDSLHFRGIGPASMSGRISDLAVYEADPAIYYVGTAHGGVRGEDEGLDREPDDPYPFAGLRGRRPRLRR